MIKLRSTLILVLSSILIGGVIYWRSKKQSLETTYTLPSPHMTENETLFLSNITPEQITGWTLTSPTETLVVDRNVDHANLGTSQSQTPATSSNPYWHVYYETTSRTAPKKELPSPIKSHHSKKARDLPNGKSSYRIDFQGANSEILANGRNFLSLSYVNEDLTDTSSLKALSMKYHTSIIKAEDLAALVDIDNRIVNAYSLTYQSLESLLIAASAPTAAKPLVPKELKTVTFLEGKAAAPFRKLYFQGKAYWVREWYILALARHPAELHVKQFLTLSPHTLERIEKRTLHTTSAKHSSAALGFTIIRTAPYTWQLLPAKEAHQETQLTPKPSQFTPHNPSVQNNTPSKPPPKPSSIAKLTTSQITEHQKTKNNFKDDSQNNSQKNHLDSNPTASTNSKVTAFIQMLLFLKAERALVLLSEAERQHITENALAKSTLDFTSLTPINEDASPHKKSNAAITNHQNQKQTITLYHYEAETYIETVATEPLYLLSSQKPHTLLYYGYEDFLR
ncbi:hypothetical protein COTS27_01641 [Spirochaetota bacterium]|nr:hypothetical protein COTS27_01641 [Spirochaetota bacterium]